MQARLFLVALPPVLACALTPSLRSVSTGIYFPGLTQFAPACGACHNPAAGAPSPFQPIRVSLQPSARVLSTGQSIGLTLSATGGQSASPNGGFSMDTTAGTFSAGANTQVIAPGDAITHTNSGQRSWSMGYTAPATPGVVDLRVVCNTVNNDRINGPEDLWAFHGFTDTATQVTPVRLYVNAANVVPLGTACAGSFGNVPVLGADTVPAVGNAAFALHLHGAAPLTVAGLLLGVVPFPGGLDLSGLGITGCSLYVDPIVTLFGATGAGDAHRGEGAASFAVPIPGSPSLRNATLHFQSFVFDVANGRPLTLTMTNGLSATIQ